jgi:putative toxin-antitoxin system antitoxin component (TIGR02293 family)
MRFGWLATGKSKRFGLIDAKWHIRMSKMANQKNTARLQLGPKAARKAVFRDGLGLRGKDAVGIVKVLESGLPFRTLSRFQKESGLPWPVIAQVLRLPRRTLARRKSGGRLDAAESERLYRLAQLYRRAEELFEGNASATRNWLKSPNRGLGHASPLSLAASEIGARAVEDLIGRLEYGVYS